MARILFLPGHGSSGGLEGALSCASNWGAGRLACAPYSASAESAEAIAIPFKNSRRSIFFLPNANAHAGLLRQREGKPRVVGSDQQILTSIELIRHGSIGHELSQVDMPQSLARSRIHAQKISERVAPEQKIS